MPLLNRKQPWQPAAKPADLQPDEEVWVIKATDEVFRSYEEFVKCKSLYDEEVWSCKYSGKGGLTLEGALELETKAVVALAQFPKDLEEQVCRAVHHSLGRIDEVVGAAYDSLRPASPAPPAAQPQASEQQPSPLGSKENEGPQPAAAAANKPGGEEGGEGAAAPAAPTPAAERPDAAAGAAEARSGRKGSKTPKAPVSKPLMRTFILENAEQQGAEHATKQVWVVKRELRERYGLADKVPAAVQEQLQASVKAPKRKQAEDAPKGLGGALLPAKKRKTAGAGGPGSPSGSKPAGGEGGSEPAKPSKEKGPMVAVQAKSWEEVEKQYKEGTLKHVLAAVLKTVQPEALSTQGIMDKAKELGLKEFEEKHKAAIASAMATDPNFIRLSKGSYSLHCFHADKEQLVRAPQPKGPKESKKAAAAAGESTPAAKGGATPAASTAQRKEKEAVPMIAVQAKSWEEVEKQYKEGTLKHALAAVLKAVQPEALTAQGAVDKAKELGIAGLEEKQKAISHAFTNDQNFIRLSKGAYSLHCFHADKEQLVRAPQPKEKKAAAEGGDDATPAAKGGEAHPEKEAVPMIAVQAKSWEEVEKQYKEGTLKHVLAAVLKAVQPEALSTQGIMDKAKELGLKEFEEKHKATIGQAMATDPNFIRLSKGAYSLHCFYADKEQLVRAPQKKRKMTDFLGDGEEGSKQPEGGAPGEEVDSITRAEYHVKVTKRALGLHRGALEKAQAEYDAAKARFDAEKKLSRTPAKDTGRAADIHIPAEQLARFEIPEDEREFKGEADDRKGLLEHRQKLQARAKELEKAKKAFIEGERLKRERAAKDANKEAKAAETAFRKAERALEHERRSVESAERAAAAAEKKLEKEKERAAKGEEKAKEREEREKQKVQEKEERERRRAEKAKEKEDAKRYPMDDLELLQELRHKAAETGEPVPEEDVAQPAWMEASESQRLANALYIADLATQFAKQLGVKALHYDAFERVLADATAKHGTRAPPGEDVSAATLHNLYERLLEVILEDLRAEDVATAQEKRWCSLLGPGTWPEVLRRLVLTRAAEEDADMRPEQAAVLAATMLAYDGADSLTHDQHLHLLRFLCDCLLDSEKMRGVLQRREDEALDAKRDVREEMAEQRKQLKELLDAEKEERKRKREEERKRLEEEAEKKAAAVAVTAAEEGAEGAEAGGAGEAAKQGSGAAPMEVDARDEPSFQLPERLREYGGPADDKKLLLQWRQEQQAEKRRLEKERNKWVAEQLRRQRDLEAAEKAAKKEREEKQREKEEKEEAIFMAQEALEEKLEKYAVRRQPLGADRHQRRYWWGLAGHRPVVWVEDDEGRWGSFSSVAELEGLLASLDRRGVRELALAESLEKRFQTISMAMQRAERAAVATADKGGRQADRPERLEPPRRSGRQTQQPEFYDPAKAAKAPDVGLLALCGPAECAAGEAAAELMQGLQKAAAPLVDPPEGSTWKEWGAAVAAATEGELGESVGGKPTAAAVRGLLRSKLQQLEEALLGASKGGLAAEGEEEEEEEGSAEAAGEGQGSEDGSPRGAGGVSRTQSAQVLDVVDDLFSPTKRPSEVLYLWKTQRERTAWQTDLRQASTAARIAYCAAVLEQAAEPMLAALSKAASKASGGKKGGKGAGGKGAGSGKGAAAGSRPVSRTNSVANLEAAAAAAGGSKGAGKSGGGGKRKAPAPLPENMRQTRSRH